MFGGRKLSFARCTGTPFQSLLRQADCHRRNSGPPLRNCMGQCCAKQITVARTCEIHNVSVDREKIDPL